MTFLTLMGGLFIFGLLWLFFPRTSFAAALAVALHLSGVKLFAETPSFWEGCAGGLFLVAIVGGFIADILFIRFVRDEL